MTAFRPKLLQLNNLLADMHKLPCTYMVTYVPNHFKKTNLKHDTNVFDNNITTSYIDTSKLLPTDFVDCSYENEYFGLNLKTPSTPS